MILERTLVLIKPDAVKRKLVGEVISRYERANLKVVEMKLEQFDYTYFEELYREHEGKEFYVHLVKNMSSAPIVALVIEGPRGTVAKVRMINGVTDPVQAAPGTIRGDLAAAMDPDNVVHGSDSVENGKREIRIFFG